MKSWIEHQRRHLSASAFDAWVAGSEKVQTFLARQAKIPAAVRALDDLQRDILKKVMAPAVEKGSEHLAQAQKAGTPNRTGTLRQSIGSVKAKLYAQSLTAWSASGPRRGYGRIIQRQTTKRGRTRLKRLSKAQSEGYRMEGEKFADPVRYARLVIGGRRAITAGVKHVVATDAISQTKGRQRRATKRKALMDSFTGRFFGHSVRAAAPKDFLARAASGADQAAAIATQEMNTKLNEYLYLAPE